MATRRSGLGKGLGALIPAPAAPVDPVEVTEGVLRDVGVDEIIPNSHQPRMDLDEDALEGLAASITAVGVLQPLLVRLRPGGGYELIAGERRWRAARQAGLKTVPVVLRDATEEESLEQAIVENLHRKDLNPVDEALGLKRLVDEFGFSQEQVARRVGKNRATVANSFRLLGLPEDMQDAMRDGRMTAGHGRAILSAPGDAAQRQLFDEVLRLQLTVREAEMRAKSIGGTVARSTRKAARSADAALRFVDARDQLAEHLDTRVSVQASGKGGKLTISFADEEDLSRIMTLVTKAKAARL